MSRRGKGQGRRFASCAASPGDPRYGTGFSQTSLAGNGRSGSAATVPGPGNRVQADAGRVYRMLSTGGLQTRVAEPPWCVDRNGSGGRTDSPEPNLGGPESGSSRANAGSCGSLSCDRGGIRRVRAIGSNLGDSAVL